MKKWQIGSACALFSIALPTVGAAQDQSTPSSPKGSPAIWFPQNIYPAEAKRNGEQGRVTVQLSVDRSGIPTACKVIGSSGSAALDARTCELALANARFTPAKDERGNPIASTFTLPGVRWVLNGNFTLDLSTGGTSKTLRSVRIDVDAAGRGVSCRPAEVTQGPGGCETFKPGVSVTPPLLSNGKPVAGMVTVTTTMRIEPK